MIALPVVTVAVVDGKDDVTILGKTNRVVPCFSGVWSRFTCSSVAKNECQRIACAVVLHSAERRSITIGGVITKALSHAETWEMVMEYTVCLWMTVADIEGVSFCLDGVLVARV